MFINDKDFFYKNECVTTWCNKLIYLKNTCILVLKRRICFIDIHRIGLKIGNRPTFVLTLRTADHDHHSWKAIDFIRKMIIPIVKQGYTTPFLVGKVTELWAQIQGYKLKGTSKYWQVNCCSFLVLGFSMVSSK
jgi:hypothetical protein